MFLLQVTFIRRVLQFRLVRFALLVVFIGAVIAALIYTTVVLRAVQERNQAPHVHTHHSR